MAGTCKAAGKTLRKSRQNAGSHDPATLHTNRTQQNYKTYLLDSFQENFVFEKAVNFMKTRVLFEQSVNPHSELSAKWPKVFF